MWKYGSLVPQPPLRKQGSSSGKFPQNPGSTAPLHNIAVIMNQVTGRRKEQANPGGIKKPICSKCDAPLRGIDVLCSAWCEKILPLDQDTGAFKGEPHSVIYLGWIFLAPSVYMCNLKWQNINQAYGVHANCLHENLSPKNI